MNLRWIKIAFPIICIPILGCLNSNFPRSFTDFKMAEISGYSANNECIKYFDKLLTEIKINNKLAIEQLIIDMNGSNTYPPLFRKDKFSHFTILISLNHEVDQNKYFDPIKNRFLKEYHHLFPEKYKICLNERKFLECKDEAIKASLIVPIEQLIFEFEQALSAGIAATCELSLP